MYTHAHEHYHRALVRRFHYAIFYEYEEGAVNVHGILHTARNPDKWQQRRP